MRPLILHHKCAGAFKVRQSTPLEGTLLDKTTDSAQQNTGERAGQTVPVEGTLLHKATDSAQQIRAEPNSKHWFTTSFLQPLPYLVTP